MTRRRITCGELEARLEALVDGALADAARAACEEHLGRCRSCALLVELARATEPAARRPQAAAPADLAAEVLRRTSGPACAEAEPLLAARADGEPPATERELLDVHLAHCPRCRSLAAALAALTRDLPAMAELAPEAGFVRRVLAESLPLAVRLRRWRRDTWPRWLRRPRFALEMAYALTALLVVVVNIPGTPLAAMPRQAVELSRTPPIDEIERALERPVREGLDVWRQSAARRRLAERIATAESAARDLRRRAPRLIDESVGGIRTFLAGVASWLENGDEDISSPQDEPTEETS